MEGQDTRELEKRKVITDGNIRDMTLVLGLKD